MAEFLAEVNVCGQSLLQIVAVGNAIIAEILRVKDFIPDLYRLKEKQEQLKYADIIQDFSYFKISEVQEKKIEDNAELKDLDEEVRENYLEILTRCYLAFESVHQYVSDLKFFINEVNDGTYIQHSLESILQDCEGKQLLTESLYLYGVMLLVLDMHIPGIVRERILVSYHRYGTGKSYSDSNIEDICMLLRSTGFTNASDAKRVPNYPEEYFRRVGLDETFVEMIIGRLRSDDIYNQIAVYPMPEHRSTALANQAAMLYVCLFFSPRTLHQQQPQMREIVDKFFYNNWIISIYMGITVNLIDAWEPYKAAKNALINVIDAKNIKEIASMHATQLKKLIAKTQTLLKEGVVTQQILIKNIIKIVNLIRECDVTLRWLLLHTSKPAYDCSNNKKCKQVETQVINDSGYNSLDLFELLLNISQLEFHVREIIKDVLTEKESQWNNCRKEAHERLSELSVAFSSSNPLMKIKKNDDLTKWFADIASEVDGLSHENANVSGRKITQLIQALERVQEYHNLNTNMQVKQHLLETDQYLHRMIQTINIKEENLINLQIIGDLSYAWITIDNYTAIMQESVKKQPSLVIKLRATFLKLASTLEIPLMRINQARSDDLESVSQYYSNELVNYVRKVIQIIPKSIFEILEKIIKIQTESMREVPTRLDKDKVREYAQLDERYAVAKNTYQISVFTKGILMMKKTLVGVIELDPKQLLEDGLRKELVRHLAESLHNGLTFNVKAKSPDVELIEKLTSLAKVIDGYKRSFEYVQDYLNIYGFKIWQEEMYRIINYNVERECNTFLRKKVQDWQSEFQSSSIPIPVFPPTDTQSETFIGRLSNELLRITDPRTTVFIASLSKWFDFKTQKSLLHINVMSRINECIEPAGLVGLDRLYSHMIKSDLDTLVDNLEYSISNDKGLAEVINTFNTDGFTSSPPIEQPLKFYNNLISKFTKATPKILDLILAIGQKQLLRKYIAFELNSSCKFNSKNLERTLRTLNDSLLIDLKAHELDPKNPCPSIEVLCEVNDYLEWTGIYNPYDKVYIERKHFRNISTAMTLLTLSQLTRLNYVRNITTLMGKKSGDHLDGVSFVIRVLTVLRQYHVEIVEIFIDAMAQYVVSMAQYYLPLKKEIGSEAYTAVHFLFQFIQFGRITREVLEHYIPEVLLNQLECLANKIQVF